MTKRVKFVVELLLLAVAVCACRDDKQVLTPQTEKVDSSSVDMPHAPKGFFLLNEGNMGSNKATLDYYDIISGEYSRNVYASANPNMVQELGDVGNDLQIYGGKMYAVINCSNFVEVMDVRNAKHVGMVCVPNCRYLAFAGKYGYLTSYAGPVSIDPNYKQIGYVAKFDTATFQVVDTCFVGFQPDEIEIVGDRIYVANSGGYMAPNYENTVSVIDLNTFKELKRIEVVNNLHRLKADNHGQLWVSSRGDYFEQPSRLYCIDIESETVVDSVSIPVSDFDLVGDSLYVYGAEFSYETYETQCSYRIVNTATHQVVCDNFITDGSDAMITVPYGLKVNTWSKEIYVTDARNYVSPGRLHCYSSEGHLKWTVVTGDIPAHIAFVY